MQIFKFYIHNSVITDFVVNRFNSEIIQWGQGTFSKKKNNRDWSKTDEINLVIIEK